MDVTNVMNYDTFRTFSEDLSAEDNKDVQHYSCS